jgi:hypothetical protein
MLLDGGSKISRGLLGFIGGVTLAVATGFSAAPAQALIYGIKSCGPHATNPSCPYATPPSGSGAPAALFTFNENGTGFSVKGSINIAGSNVDADALAISQNLGLFAFEVGPMGSRLLSVNTTTAGASTIGGFMTGRDIRGATFDLNDKLLVLDAASSELIRIDPATGAIVGAPLALTLGVNPYTLHNGVDIAVRPDGTLLIVNYDLNTGFTQFLDVNPATGALNLVHTDSVLHPGATHAVFHPGATFSQVTGASPLFTYEANDLEDIFTYSSTWVRSQLIVNIPPAYNAGRGDLAALMPFFAEGAPAPGALLLLGLGLAGFGALRRAKPSI